MRVLGASTLGLLAIVVLLSIPAAWVLQGIVILTGFLAPLMFVIGAIFAILWFYAVRLGTRIDAQRGDDRVAP